MARRQVSLPAFVVVDRETAQHPLVDGRVDLGSIVQRRLYSSPASLDLRVLVLWVKGLDCNFVC